MMAGPRWLVVILLSSVCLGAPIDEILSRRRIITEEHRHDAHGRSHPIPNPFSTKSNNNPEEIPAEESVIPLSAESVANMLNELIEAPEDIKQELVEQTSREITKQLKMTRFAGVEESRGSGEEDDSESEEDPRPDSDQSVLHIIELKNMNKEEESEENDDDDDGGRDVRRIRIRKLRPDLSQRTSKAFGDRKKGISKQLGSFRYAVKNKKSEQVFGHQAMYGETDQSGSYFVQFSDGRILYVTYTADHRGYRPLLRYFDSREELNAFLRPEAPGGQIFPPRTTTAVPVSTTPPAVLLTTQRPVSVLPGELSSKPPSHVLRPTTEISVEQPHALRPTTETSVEQPLVAGDLDVESSQDVAPEVVPITAPPVEEAPLTDASSQGTTLTTMQDDEGLTTTMPSELSTDASTNVDSLVTSLPELETLAPELDQFNNEATNSNVSTGESADVDDEDTPVTTISTTPEILDAEVDVISTPEEEEFAVTTSIDEDGALVTMTPEEDTLVTVDPEEGSFTLNESEEVSLVTSKPEEDSLITKQPETLASGTDEPVEGSLTTSIPEEESFTTSGTEEDILVTSKPMEESLVTTENPFVFNEQEKEVLVTSKPEEENMDDDDSDEEDLSTEEEVFVTSEPEEEVFVTSEPEEEVFVTDEPEEIFVTSEPEEEIFVTSEPEEEIFVTNEPVEGSLVTSIPEEEHMVTSKPVEDSFVTSSSEEPSVTSDYEEGALVTSKPEEETFDNSEPETELSDTNKPEEDTLTTVNPNEFSVTSKPEEESFTTSSPEEEFLVTSEPDEESLITSEPEEEEILVTSNPEEETFGTIATEEEVDVTTEPEGEFLTTVRPEEEVFVTSEPEDEDSSTKAPVEETVVTDRPNVESVTADQDSEEPAASDSVKEQLSTTVTPKEEVSNDSASDGTTERPDSLSDIDATPITEDSLALEDDSLLEAESGGLSEESLQDVTTPIPEDAEDVSVDNQIPNDEVETEKEAVSSMSMSDAENILTPQVPPAEEEEEEEGPSANGSDDNQEGNVINILPPPSPSEKALYMEMLPKNLDMSIVPSVEEASNEAQVPSNTSNANTIPIIPHGDTRPEYVAISVLQKDKAVAPRPSDAKEDPSNQDDAEVVLTTPLPPQRKPTHHQLTLGSTTQTLVRKPVERARNLSSRRNSLLFGKRRPSALTMKLRPSLKLPGQRKTKEDDSASESQANGVRIPPRRLSSGRRVPTSRNARLYQHWLKRQSRTLGALKNRRLSKN